MGSIKRTFTLPKNISEDLDKLIPNRERSKFLAAIISEALAKRQKLELLDMIDNLETCMPDQPSKSIVETLREIRAD